MKDKKSICAECKSEFFAESSEMKGLCCECSHRLYGYDNCKHQFEKGRCVKCYWDGSLSTFLNKENK